MNEPRLVFRRMTLADLDRVMRVEEDVYEFPWTRRIFSDCISVGYLCWLAFRGQDAVGHAVISVTADESHMLNLSIAREFQGRGYGRQFIEFLVQQARERHAETMLLEVRPSNTTAISCYNSAGFNEVGSRKDYYPAPGGREDALLFAKQITPSNKSASG